MTITTIMENVGFYVDFAGVLTILMGLLLSGGRFIVALASSAEDAYDKFRRSIGRSILLGLEVLVAADIIRTVAVTPTLTSVTVLGGIVVIRTFLSMSIQIELDGQLPWKRAPSDRTPAPLG